MSQDERDLGPLPTIHTREAIVHKAERALDTAISLWKAEHRDLTTTELLSVMNHIFSSAVGVIMKHLIRQERHGDSDKPGGWA